MSKCFIALEYMTPKYKSLTLCYLFVLIGVAKSHTETNTIQGNTAKIDLWQNLAIICFLRFSKCSAFLKYRPVKEFRKHQWEENSRDDEKWQGWGNSSFFGVLQTYKHRPAKYYFSKKLLYYKCQSKYCILVQNILLQKYIIHSWRKLRGQPPLAIAGYSMCTKDKLCCEFPGLATTAILLSCYFSPAFHV